MRGTTIGGCAVRGTVIAVIAGACLGTSLASGPATSRPDRLPSSRVCQGFSPDTDGDGVCDDADCAPTDPTAWTIPAELAGLRLAPDKTGLSWEPAPPGAGTGAAVLRGVLGELPVGSGARDACVAPATGTSAQDAAQPDVGQGFWYLVRAWNSCGTGSYGLTSNDMERTSPACTSRGLQVVGIPEIPPVRATDDPETGTCTLTLGNVSATLMVVGTSSPLDDVIVQLVTLSYVWDAALPEIPSRTVALGVVIPAGGSGTVSFPPIALGDLIRTDCGPGGNQACYLGHSASVSMVFRGQTVAGEDVTASGGGRSDLAVSSCTCADADDDGLCDSIDLCPGCANPSCTGEAWCAVAGNPCPNVNPTCP